MCYSTMMPFTRASVAPRLAGSFEAVRTLPLVCTYRYEAVRAFVTHPATGGLYPSRSATHHAEKSLGVWATGWDDIAIVMTM